MQHELKSIYTKMNESWERLRRVIEWSGLSINGFAKRIGLTYAESLYRIKRGQNGISKELATKITETYPTINRVWLLMGEETMLSETKTIPFYKTTIDLLPEKDGVISQQPNAYITTPFEQDVSFAVFCGSSAMEPRIETSDVLILKRIEPEQIIVGEIYLFVNKFNYSMLRRVKKSREKNKYLLIADKKSKFDPIELDVSSIKSVYAVCGSYNKIL